MTRKTVSAAHLVRWDREWAEPIATSSDSKRADYRRAALVLKYELDAATRRLALAEPLLAAVEEAASRVCAAIVETDPE